MAKKEISFSGFTAETFQFFRDIKENNNKEWFDAHKHIYEESVLTPLKALVVNLSPTMHNIDPNFELRPHRAVSRIYRDTRFSKNKEPYKNCMWLTFQIPMSREEWKDYPGYFMEITADAYTIGMGLFMPKKKTMDIYREEISYNMDEFQHITQKTILDRGFEVMGEEYKRPIASSLPDYFQPWIQRKGIWVGKTVSIGEEAFSVKLSDKIREDFEALKWFYNFLKESVELQ